MPPRANLANVRFWRIEVGSIKFNGIADRMIKTSERKITRARIDAAAEVDETIEGLSHSDTFELNRIVRKVVIETLFASGHDQAPGLDDVAVGQVSTGDGQHFPDNYRESQKVKR